MFGNIFIRVREKWQAWKKRCQSSCPDEHQPGGKVPNGADDAKAPVSPAKPCRPPVRNKKPKWDLTQFVVEPEAGKARFHDFSLPLSLMHGIADLGFQYCTPIQEKALPEVLAKNDVIGQANTGTGKSAVFLIGIIAGLMQGKPSKYGDGRGRPRALIIAPTRELVSQIVKDGRKLAKYTPIKLAAVYGGSDYQRQLDSVRSGRCDVVVATPGRLLDFMWKKAVLLEKAEIFVLDEADRMLDMGFIPDVRRIEARLPRKNQRQTMLFSATISSEVRRLADGWCRQPVTIRTEPEQVAVDTVDQRVYMVSGGEKYAVLYNLIKNEPTAKIIVFANQKNEAKKLAEQLAANQVKCSLLSGDVTQDKRERRLNNFRQGRVKVLVATDVAGRGLHISDIEYVVNYTLPYEPEDYVHRIGRTGRAGRGGVAISFACEKGGFYLPDIEEYIGRKLACTLPDEKLLIPPPPTEKTGQRKRKRNRPPRPNGRRNKK
ncbi:MAG: ATP-dependent RNA helicase RhlB [Deltaproteobacteria bacterium]|nr:MAG: ATP-dependent RNA helicase RhlB [Deltaproteobacteria bacterium]